MSNERVSEFVHRLILEDESLTKANDCRNSVIELKREIETFIDGAEVWFLAFPEARKGNGVHYSLLVNCDGASIIINLIPAPGFPEYVGDFELAVPMFSVMQRVNEVI